MSDGSRLTYASGIPMLDKGEVELLVAVRRTKRESRLALVREAVKWDMELSDPEIVVGGHVFSLRTEWKVLRPRVLRALKLSAWTQLATRRPVVFRGLESAGVNADQHKKLLAALPPMRRKFSYRYGADVP